MFWLTLPLLFLYISQRFNILKDFSWEFTNLLLKESYLGQLTFHKAPL